MVNKDKWKENRQTWNKLTKTEKKIRIVIIIALAILVLLGLIMFLIYS